MRKGFTSFAKHPQLVRLGAAELEGADQAQQDHHDMRDTDDGDFLEARSQFAQRKVVKERIVPLALGAKAVDKGWQRRGVGRLPRRRRAIPKHPFTGKERKLHFFDAFERCAVKKTKCGAGATFSHSKSAMLVAVRLCV